MSDPVSKIIVKQERGGRWKTVIGVVVVLAVIGIFIPKSDETTPSKNTTASSQPATLSSTPALDVIRLASVKLEKMSWRKDAFETVMMLNFTIVNTNAFEIKDIEVTCKEFGNSGTLIDRNVRVVYETVKAKGSKRMRNFNMGFIRSQATKASCSVTDFKS